MSPPDKKAFGLLLCHILLALSLAGCSGGEPDNTPAQGYVNQGSFEDEPESPQISDCTIGQPLCREVLDCSDSETCVSRGVTFDIEACAETENRKKCENFAERLQSVTLVSDAYNFITSPFTEHEMSAEFIVPLKRPWDLAPLPDGSLLVTQIGGEIILISNGQRTKLEHDLDILVPPGTGGLLGLAIDPEFAENSFIYIVYTHAYFDEFDPDRPYNRRLINRVSRLTLEDGKLVDEVVLLDRIPASLQHAGSRLAFGPDGKLYVTTGDADQDAMSQLWSFHGGKILRMNPDGSPPLDNPSPGNYVYSLGHRNPQGLAWHPETGDLYASEHGPKRYDEINRILPGKNHGWGSYRCDDRSWWGRRKPSGEYIYPLVCPKHWNLSPSGMEFVSDPESPWFGSLFVASLRGKHLHRYVFEGDEIVVDEIFYVVDNEFLPRERKKGRMSQRIRDVAYLDGSLYIIGDNAGLLKLTPKPVKTSAAEVETTPVSEAPTD